MGKLPIKCWISEANEEGLFEDPDPGMSSSTSISTAIISQSTSHYRQLERKKGKQ